MPGAAAALLEGVIDDTDDDTDELDDFDPVVAVTPVEDIDFGAMLTGSKAAKAAKPRKRSTKTSSTKARTAVASALSALEPDAAPTTRKRAKAGAVAKAPTVLAAVSATGPVPRPNGEMYHPRMLGPVADVTALAALRAAGLHVLLRGQPGVGKTALVEAMAFNPETSEADLVTFEGHGDAEVGDLVGTYVQLPDGRYEWVDGPLTIAMREGKVLLLDELSVTPSMLTARVFPAMDGRQTIRLREHQGETVTAAPGFMVIGAYNPYVPGAQMSEALLSRFALHVEVNSDMALARELGVDDKAIRTTAALHKLRASGTTTWAPEMRELLGFQRLTEVLGIDVAISNLVGLAPPEEQEDVLGVVAAWFPTATPLLLGKRA